MSAFQISHPALFTNKIKLTLALTKITLICTLLMSLFPQVPFVLSPMFGVGCIVVSLGVSGKTH